MFFRNLTLYRFAQTIDTDELENRLETVPIREPGPIEIETSGFVPVLGADQVLRWCGNTALFCVGYRTRLLPAVVVHEELAKRMAIISQSQGRRVGAKERRQLKEDIVSQLLPQAFVKPARVYAYIDVKDGWLVIDTASRSVAEDVVNMLRTALGRFPCTPVTPEDPPRVVMTDWLIHNKLPADVSFGDEIDLRDPAEGGSKWNGRATDLETDEVREHLKSGMQVWRLGLRYADRIAFVLGEDMVVHKLRFLDSALDELDDSAESAAAELDARFALMRLELERLFVVLCAAFRIPREAKLALDGGDAPMEMRAPIRNSGQEKFAAEVGAALKNSGLKIGVNFRVAGSLTDELNRLTDLSKPERDWLAGGERGSSSETIFAKLHGGVDLADGDTFPLDPADLRRCRLLLEAVPDFAPRLHEMRSVSPVWSRFVDGWDELCHVFDTECPNWRGRKWKAERTYELMQHLIDGTDNA